MLTHSSFPPITIFSGSKIRLNDSKIYIFELYSSTDSILYCRKFDAHRGITVLGELNKKNTNLIAFKNNEIKSISIELDKYMMRIGEEMGYQMTYGNIPLAGIAASLGGYFGAWKGAIISMIPMILFKVAEVEEFSPILVSAGCLGSTAFTLAEMAFHAEHSREKFNTGFLKIPLSGENSWKIISQFDLNNY